MSPYRSPGEPGEPRGAGGTAGGVGEFLIGFAMLIAGGYLFLDSVMVTSDFGSLFGWGRGSFGLSLVPLFAGVVALFFNGKSKIGWALTFGGLIIIVAGVVSRLQIYFRPRSLFDTLLMLVLIAGGVGLIARALRPHLSRER
jgi:hypothetical protein